MPIRFFKIVVNPQDQRLRIPPEFISRHGHNLPDDKITLKAPSGPKIQVDLIQYSNGETWLDKGWDEFKEYHSIGFAHMLMFEFDECSTFNVIIFDTSAVEIEYQCLDNAAIDNSVGQIPKSENVEPKPGNSAIYFNDLLTSKKRKYKGKGKCKKLQEVEHLSLKCKTRGSGKQRSLDVQVQRVDRERCVSYQNALAFMYDNKTRNPFYISVMQPSYHSTLTLPLIFTRESLPKRCSDISLHTLDGREWRIRCIIGTCNAKITCGWKKFVQDNALKVGDACLFDVIEKSDDPKWNVVIFRG